MFYHNFLLSALKLNINEHVIINSKKENSKIMHSRKTKPKLSILNTDYGHHELDDDLDLDNLTENISLSSPKQNDLKLNTASFSKSINKIDTGDFIFNFRNQNEDESVDNLEEDDPLDAIFEYENDDNELYLCIFYQNSKLACSYYDLNKKILFTLNDVQENVKYEMTRLLINDLNPTTIITCAKCDQKFLRFIKLKCKYNIDDRDSSNEDMNENNLPYDVENEDYSLTVDPSNKYLVKEKQINLFILSSNDFNYDNGKNRIIQQLNDIDQMPLNMNQTERIIYFSGLFDFESKLLIKSVGGLLKYFDRNRASLNLSADILGQIQILSVRPISLDKILLLDSNTYKSLQIFNNVDYVCANKLTETLDANSFRTSFNDKFNYTLYSLYSTKIQTKIGISKLRSYLMKPIRDEIILNKRYKVVEFFINNRNHEYSTVLIKTLKKCKFINQILKRMRISKCNLNEWKRLYNTTHAFFKIAKLSALINERITSNKFQATVSYKNNTNLSNCKFETFRNHLLKNFDYSKSNGFQRSSLLDSDGESMIKRNINSETPCLTNTENISSLKGSSSNYPQEDDNNDTIFSYIINKDFAAKFEHLINLFDRVINLKESNELKKCKINTNISAELDEKKQIYAKLPEYLSRVARQELEITNLTECHVVYMPLHGFLLVIKLESIVNQANKIEMKKISIFEKDESKINDDDESMESQDISNDNKQNENYKKDNEFNALKAQFEFSNKLEYLFDVNDQYYYKNERMRELDVEFGDLSSQINDIESEILEKLQSEFIK